MMTSPYTGRTVQSGIYADATHLLPPSFRADYSLNEYAFVEYKIQVMFKFDGEEEPFVTGTGPLQFTPYNPCPQNPPSAEFVKPAQKYSSSRLVGQEKSLRNTFKDVFSSGTPSLNVSMKCTVPHFVTSSGSFPIYTCIELDSFSSLAIEVPLINVKVHSLKLCSATFYRSVKYRGMSLRHEHEAQRHESLPLNAIPEWRQVEQQSGKAADRTFTYFPATFEARIPSTTCPSFRTFNINHGFLLELKLEAEVCEKKFEFKVEVPNFIVFPS